MSARKLTEVELFYIAGNVDKKTPEEIAKELKKPLKLVKAECDRINEEQAKPDLDKTHFARHESGAVAYTAAQSMHDDGTGEKPGEASKDDGLNKEFLEKYKGNIHIIKKK